MTRKNFQAEIKKITDQIIKNYRPEKIILFGSAVSGKIGKDSDLDLVIIKNTPKRFYDRIGEVLHILWSRKPYPFTGVDILVYTSAEFEVMKKSSFFVRDEIIEKGKIIYEQ